MSRDSGSDSADQAELVGSGEPASVEVLDAAEPPVVARLVVEIRSDGRYTIARGALEEYPSGQKVAIDARGKTPLSLAASLAKAMVQAPRWARRAARTLAASRVPRSKRLK